ncbi:MAG: polysaccharide deacetylase family protein [Polyangiaceae bacterium]
MGTLHRAARAATAAFCLAVGASGCVATSHPPVLAPPRPVESLILHELDKSPNESEAPNSPGSELETSAVTDAPGVPAALVEGPAIQASRACELPLTIDRESPRKSKIATLTFDDGPRLGATGQILDKLAAHHWSGTFFVVGKAINRRTYRLIQRMVAEGHEVGLHSYNHDVEMATFGTPAVSREYILGEHVVTRALVDLSMVATSEEDFDALFERVLEKKPFTFLSDAALVTEHEAVERRAREVLAERGFTDHAAQIRFSRPPGGGPFLSAHHGAARGLYEGVLEGLGYTNVLWHGASGDTVDGHFHDVPYLAGNTLAAGRHGGIVLLHDSIDQRALSAAFEGLAAENVTVLGLSDWIETSLCHASE